MVSFGEMQVYPFVKSCLDDTKRFDYIWVDEEEFIREMLPLEQRKTRELYVASVWRKAMASNETGRAI